MTTQEFSTQFDLLYNNISSNQAPGLNEYEKSVFLTKAQNMLVKEYFNPRTDGSNAGFDGSQKRQYDFSSLIKTGNLPNANIYETRVNSYEKLDQRSLVYLFPKDCFLAVNELLSDGLLQYVVQPIDYAEYQRLMLKPYSFPVKRAAWRIFTNKRYCNYCTGTDTTLHLQTSWYKANSSLEITINASNDISDIGDISAAIAVDASFCYENYTWVNPETTEECTSSIGISKNIHANTSGGSVYEMTISVAGDVSKDADVIACLKSLFSDIKKDDDFFENSPEGTEEEFKTVMDYTDGFFSADVSYNGQSFFTVVEGDVIGTIIASEAVEVPVAEIIGKFKVSVPQYQIRYVRNLTPIILDDLTNYGTDIDIDGLSDVTECILPEETHEEILERAVALAKIAWQGGTATQVAAQQNRES